MIEGRLMTGNGMEDPPNELDRWIWELGYVDRRLHCLQEQGCAGGCVGKRYTAFGSEAVSEAMLW